jgi:predicted RNA binding protein YcfA (HicA-like mRNA interferase family)
MPSLRPVNYKKFEQFLKYIGCSLVRTRGDHRVWSRADLKRPVILPSVKDLPVFIIRNNLRVLNITPEEYLEIIDRL